MIERPSSLSILAGPAALTELRDGGLTPERVRVFVGASGGPKWLVLHGLDRVVFPWLLGSSALLSSSALLGSSAPIEALTPVHVIGSSIGSWRAACLATPDPVSALDRLCDAYIEQRYVGKPTPAVVSATGVQILDAMLGDSGVAPIVRHPRLRLHVVTARMRHLAAREGTAQQLGLGLAILLNAIDRRALRGALERVVFDAAGDPGPFAPWRSLPTTHVPLTERNCHAALTASAAIPAVMDGVRDPEGAPPGTYRDGGVADYHFGAEIDAPDGITLYPHFFPYLVPGWFDKGFKWRRTRGLSRTVILAPSPEHVARLPGGRIPDRDDFVRMDDKTRIRAWREVIALGHRMGEEFGELVASRRIGAAARAFD